MPVETRPEITSYIYNWAGKPKEQVAEELASYALETRRIPDPYYFTVDGDGDLFHPQAKAKVKNFVLRDTSAGELEGRAFDAISSWFRQNEFGAIVWVSPPYPGIYPISKVIISEIERGGSEKRLYNRAILLDFDQAGCLKFAQDLAAFSKNHPLFRSLDQVRATPLVLNTQGRSWIYILEELIVDPILWRGIREGKDKRTKEEALMQARMVHQSLFRDTAGPSDGQKMMLEMLGEKMGSCPVVFKKTATWIFSGNSTILGTSASLESSGDYHLGSCVVCKKGNVLVGGCEICTSCEHTR